MGWMLPCTLRRWKDEYLPALPYQGRRGHCLLPAVPEPPVRPRRRAVFSGNGAPRIHRASLLYKIVAFVLSALIVVAGAFDFLLMEDTPHRHFSILMAVWAVAILRVVRAVLRRRFNGPRQIFNLLLLVSALLVFTDWFNGYTGYSLDLVVPILCCTALVCNFIFAFLRSRFTANALVYLLMNIGIGVLPYILLFFRIDYSGRLDAHSLPWVICLIISVITFLGLVIFRGRALKNEIVKRLHM